MFKNIRKILILLCIFLNSLILSANSLKDLSYREGKLVLTFEKEVSKINEDYDSKTPSLSIDFLNTNQINKSVVRQLNVNDKYISDITNDRYNNTTTTVIYLQFGTKYKLQKKGKEVIISFIEAKVLPKRNFTIVIDAGHGGHDSGAIGNGYREKDLALAVAKQLYSNLKRDYNVIMTRKDDTFIPLNERAAIGNRANANLFISIHLNASVNKEAHGSEVYYFEKNPSIYARERATAENNFDIAGTRAIESSNFLINDILYGMIQRESSSFANTILKNIVSTMSIQRRKVLGANFAVLRGSKSPSVLVELGFITNENDVRLYTSEEGQRNAANAIANAVRKHY